MKRMRFVAGLMLAACVGNAFAEAPKFPVRPVRMLVGFSPGGATDIIARYSRRR